MKTRTRIICALIVLILAAGLVPSSAMCEHTAWDCPSCKRTGNTGNYCGNCGQPAPWVDLASELNALKAEKDNLTAQIAALQTALNEQQAQYASLTAEYHALQSEKEALETELSKASTAELGLEYKVLSDGDIEITGYKGKAVKLVIPKRLDGYEVKSIGNRAFMNSNLQIVTVSDGVTDIGLYAFSGCRSLANVIIPNSVTSIGNYAFYECKSLINVTLPNSVTSIGIGAFYECSSLTSVIIPDSVTSIDEDAFFRCSSLTIYGKANSTAAVYAKNNGIRFVAQ